MFESMQIRNTVPEKRGPVLTIGDKLDTLLSRDGSRYATR